MIKNEVKTVLLTKDGITKEVEMTIDYFRFFIESGYDLDYEKVEVK